MIKLQTPQTCSAFNLIQTFSPLHLAEDHSPVGSSSYFKLQLRSAATKMRCAFGKLTRRLHWRPTMPTAMTTLHACTSKEIGLSLVPMLEEGQVRLCQYSD